MLQLPCSVVKVQEHAKADQQQKESRQKAEIFQRAGRVKYLREQADTGREEIQHNYLRKWGWGAGSPRTPHKDHRAERFALRKKEKPSDTMEAPTNRAKRGLPVTMSHTTPTPETRTVLALVSRLAAVTEVVSIIPPLQKWIVVKRLRAGCGSWNRTNVSRVKAWRINLYSIPRYVTQSGTAASASGARKCVTNSISGTPLPGGHTWGYA